jgi:hypothetical protein
VRLKLLAWLLQAEVADAVRTLLAAVQCPPAWHQQHAGAVSSCQRLGQSDAGLT